MLPCTLGWAAWAKGQLFARSHWTRGGNTTPATRAHSHDARSAHGNTRLPAAALETLSQTDRRADRPAEDARGPSGRQRVCLSSHAAGRAPPGGPRKRSPGREPRAAGRRRRELPNGRTQGRAEGRRVARADARRESGAGQGASPAEAATPRQQRGGAGAREAGGAVGALPRPRLPVSALGRGRVVGFGLSGSSGAGEAAREPAAVGLRLGHDRCSGLSPSTRRKHEGQRRLQGPAAHGETPSTSPSSTPSLVPRSHTRGRPPDRTACPR